MPVDIVPRQFQTHQDALYSRAAPGNKMTGLGVWMINDVST